jgi:hypothetical protein
VAAAVAAAVVGLTTLAVVVVVGEFDTAAVQALGVAAVRRVVQTAVVVAVGNTEVGTTGSLDRPVVGANLHLAAVAIHIHLSRAACVHESIMDVVVRTIRRPIAELVGSTVAGLSVATTLVGVVAGSGAAFAPVAVRDQRDPSPRSCQWRDC